LFPSFSELCLSFSGNSAVVLDDEISLVKTCGCTGSVGFLVRDAFPVGRVLLGAFLVDRAVVKISSDFSVGEVDFSVVEVGFWVVEVDFSVVEVDFSVVEVDFRVVDFSVVEGDGEGKVGKVTAKLNETVKWGVRVCAYQVPSK
jgi:hypothetical protein